MNRQQFKQMITASAILVLVSISHIAQAQYAISWNNVMGCSVSNDTIKMTASTGWGNAGASSVNLLRAGQDGYVEFYYNKVSRGSFVFGLSTPILT